MCIRVERVRESPEVYMSTGSEQTLVKSCLLPEGPPVSPSLKWE